MAEPRSYGIEAGLERYKRSRFGPNDGTTFDEPPQKRSTTGMPPPPPRRTDEEIRAAEARYPRVVESLDAIAQGVIELVQAARAAGASPADCVVVAREALQSLDELLARSDPEQLNIEGWRARSQKWHAPSAVDDTPDLRREREW